MKLLLTNDDGIDAPGLAALERAADSFGEIIVVAPDRHLSGCSHRATTHAPLKLTQVRPNRYHVDGTPADCVRIALSQISPDVDWVLSGVNEGANLGVDVYLSGTCAASREATWLGKRSIAISHYRKSTPIDWIVTARVVEDIVKRLMKRELTEGGFWNINLPAKLDGQTDEMIDCGLDGNPLPVKFESYDGVLKYNGDYHNRPRTKNSDVDICFSGRISVTQILGDASTARKDIR